MSHTIGMRCHRLGLHFVTQPTFMAARPDIRVTLNFAEVSILKSRRGRYTGALPDVYGNETVLVEMPLRRVRDAIEHINREAMVRLLMSDRDINRLSAVMPSASEGMTRVRFTRPGDAPGGAEIASEFELRTDILQAAIRLHGTQNIGRSFFGTQLTPAECATEPDRAALPAREPDLNPDMSVMAL